MQCPDHWKITDLFFNTGALQY